MFVELNIFMKIIMSLFPVLSFLDIINNELASELMTMQIYLCQRSRGVNFFCTSVTFIELQEQMALDAKKHSILTFCKVFCSTVNLDIFEALVKMVVQRITCKINL